MNNKYFTVNGIKVISSFHKEIVRDEHGTRVETRGGFQVEGKNLSDGCFVMYWDLAYIIAEFLSYGLTGREAWDAACDYFNDPEHVAPVYPGNYAEVVTCQNIGRAAAIIAARESSKEAAKESAESTENNESTNDTNDTKNAAQSEKMGVLESIRDLYEGSAPDIKKRAAKALARVNAVCRSCSLWSLRAVLLLAYLLGCLASVAITGNAVASVVGRSIPALFLVTLPCICIVTFSFAYGFIKALNWFNNRVGIFEYFQA